MILKKFVKIFIIILLISFISLIYYLNFNKEKKINLVTENNEDTSYNSNIIKDVKYTSKDEDGNEYIITAMEGEIDFSNTDILYLTKVKSVINLANSEKVTITSNFGKYNI